MFNDRFHASRADISERFTSIILNGDLTALTADEGKARNVIRAREKRVENILGSCDTLLVIMRLN